MRQQRAVFRFSTPWMLKVSLLVSGSLIHNGKGGACRPWHAYYNGQHMQLRRQFNRTIGVGGG